MNHGSELPVRRTVAGLGYGREDVKELKNVDKALKDGFVFSFEGVRKPCCTSQSGSESLGKLNWIGVNHGPFSFLFVEILDD